MSILKYLKESLINEIILNENQKEAKAIADSDKYPNFDLNDLNKLKSSLKDIKHYKYMGWIARNWENLSDESDLGELVKAYDENFGKSQSNLKDMNYYKTNPGEWIQDVKREINSLKRKSSISQIPSEQRVNTLWESNDKSIRIIVPQTKSASIKAGRGTKWCTAADTNTGVDYDYHHMFCHYVLKNKGLMIYIINDKLQSDDKFHKIAIRLLDSYGDKIEIAEIRDMYNEIAYTLDGDDNASYDIREYFSKYNIPIHKILSNIHVEVDKLGNDREIYLDEEKFMQNIVKGNIEALIDIVNDGYTPIGSRALNLSLEQQNIPITNFLLTLKTVKPNVESIGLSKNFNNNIHIKILAHPSTPIDEDTLYDIIELNDASLFKSIITKANNIITLDTKTDQIFEYILNTKDLKLIKLSINKLKCKHSVTLLDIAFYNNISIDIIEFIISNGIDITKDSINWAVMSGNVDIVNHFKNKFIYTDIDVSTLTEYSMKSLEMLKWVDINFKAEMSTYSLNIAIQENNLEIIKYAVHLGATPTETSINHAINTKNLEIIKYIANLSKDIDTDTEESLYHAVSTGDIEIVKYIASIPNIDIPQNLANSALRLYNVKNNPNTTDDMFNYLIKLPGVQCTSLTLNLAILAKKMDIIKYIVNLGVKPNEATHTAALNTKNEDIIQYIEAIM